MATHFVHEGRNVFIDDKTGDGNDCIGNDENEALSSYNIIIYYKTHSTRNYN